MSSTSESPDVSPDVGFMVLSNADFERLTLGERVEYMKSAVAALQRLQKQIQRTMEEFRAK